MAAHLDNHVAVAYVLHEGGTQPSRVVPGLDSSYEIISSVGRQMTDWSVPVQPQDGKEAWRPVMPSNQPTVKIHLLWCKPQL